MPRISPRSIPHRTRLCHVGLMDSRLGDAAAGRRSRHILRPLPNQTSHMCCLNGSAAKLLKDIPTINTAYTYCAANTCQTPVSSTHQCLLVRHRASVSEEAGPAVHRALVWQHLPAAATRAACPQPLAAFSIAESVRSQG